MGVPHETKVDAFGRKRVPIMGEVDDLGSRGHGPTSGGYVGPTCLNVLEAHDPDGADVRRLVRQHPIAKPTKHVGHRRASGGVVAKGLRVVVSHDREHATRRVEPSKSLERLATLGRELVAADVVAAEQHDVGRLGVGEGDGLREITKVHAPCMKIGEQRHPKGSVERRERRAADLGEIRLEALSPLETEEHGHRHERHRGEPLPSSLERGETPREPRADRSNRSEPGRALEHEQQRIKLHGGNATRRRAPPQSVRWRRKTPAGEDDWYWAEAMDETLTCDALTANFRVFQRARGHRFSVDDRTTAFVAAKIVASRAQGREGKVERILDLGTGIGSVLLMVGSVAVDAWLVGIEAQEVSFALLQKNLAHNGVEARAEGLFGDLRERVKELPARSFDLVTGTPPYLPIGTATPSPDGQRAAARIELRGGIEDYLRAAAHAVANDGHVVVCADGRTPERTLAAARSADLAARSVVHVIAREGDKGPLFSVWTLSRGGTSELAETSFVQRDAQGARTPESLEVLRLFGLETP